MKRLQISQTYPRGSVVLMRCCVTSQALIDGGRQPLTVNTIWDTGSTRSAVSPRLAKALGLTLRGYHNVQAANSPDVRTALLEGLFHVVGNSTFGPFVVDVVTLDKEDTPNENRLDLIVGMDFISQGRFRINPIDKHHYKFTFEI